MIQKSLLMALWALVLLMAMAAPCAVAQQDNSALLLSKAGEALAQGRNAEAIDHYDELLKAGHGSATIHYNLGIAYYRQEAFGKAVFHFKWAARLAPRDGDIKFNLAFARKKAIDKIEDTRPAAVVAAEKWGFVNEKEIWYALAGAVFICTMFSIALLFSGHDIVRFIQRLTLALVAVCLVALAVRRYGDQPFGVVTAAAADVYSGKGQNNVLLFTLHDGAEFVLDGPPAQEWIKIVLKDGKKGWMRASDVVY